MTSKMTESSSIALSTKEKDLHLDKLIYGNILVGSVLEEIDGRFIVKLENNDQVNASVSVSCLLKVVIDDRVLLVCDNSYNFFITSVLERIGSAKLELNSLDKDLIIKAKRVALIADEEITQLAASSTEIFTEKMVNTETINVFAKNGSFSLDNVSILSKKVASFVDVMTSKVKVLFQTSKVNNRTIEDIEIVNSNMRNDNIKNSLKIQSGNVIMNSRTTFNVSSKQIFMN